MTEVLFMIRAAVDDPPSGACTLPRRRRIGSPTADIMDGVEGSPCGERPRMSSRTSRGRSRRDEGAGSSREGRPGDGSGDVSPRVVVAVGGLG